MRHFAVQPRSNVTSRAMALVLGLLVWTVVSVSDAAMITQTGDFWGGRVKQGSAFSKTIDEGMPSGSDSLPAESYQGSPQELEDLLSPAGVLPGMGTVPGGGPGGPGMGTAIAPSFFALVLKATCAGRSYDLWRAPNSQKVGNDLLRPPRT